MNVSLIYVLLEDFVHALLEERSACPNMPPLMCDVCSYQVTLGGTNYPLPSMLCLCDPHAPAHNGHV